MILTDTHTHLYSEAFDDDRRAMMQRALNSGITRFFVPAIDSSYTQAMLKLEAEYPEYVHLMTGLHPTSVNQNFRSEEHTSELQSRENLVCRLLLEKTK